MNEKELKTSLKQRIVISVIAVVMLGSIIASYAAIILGGNKADANGGDQQISAEKMAEYEADYNAKLAEFKKSTQGDFDKFIKYKSEIKAYNESAANGGPVTTKDLVIGDGKELVSGDSDYYAYYVGWCADESIFDSSFDSTSDPKSFAKILDASLGMIEGWQTGVVGMRINGIREITIPSTLAYGDSMEICGGYNKPLKFLVMAKRKSDERTRMATELDDAYMKYQYALMDIDYDTQF